MKILYRPVDSDEPFKEIEVADQPLTITPTDDVAREIEEHDITLDVWKGHEYNISVDLTPTPEQQEGIRKFLDSLKISRKHRKRMFHAVTHGGAVRIHSYINADYDNGESEEFVRYVHITRPAILRRVLRALHGMKFEHDIIEHFDPKDKIILNAFEV